MGNFKTKLALKTFTQQHESYSLCILDSLYLVQPKLHKRFHQMRCRWICLDPENSLVHVTPQ